MELTKSSLDSKNKTMKRIFLILSLILSLLACPLFADPREAGTLQNTPTRTAETLTGNEHFLLSQGDPSGGTRTVEEALPLTSLIEILDEPSIGVVFDDFERQDVDGLPGTAPSGHVWQAVGSGVDGAGGNGSEIRDGRLVLPEGGNHYFFPSLNGGSFGDGVDFIPRHMGAVVRLVPSSNPGSGNALFAMLISGPNGLPSAPMIHCTFPSSRANVEKWTATGGAPLIEPFVRVIFQEPLETNDRPLVIDFEFDPGSELVTISLEGQPRVSGVFPNLASFLTDRLAWQITQGRNSEAGRIHDCQYEAVYAYSEDATGPLADRARALTLRAQATSIADTGEVVRTFNEIENAALIAADTTQVRIAFGDAGWTSGFWSLSLPSIGDVELGHAIEFFDDGFAMVPSNINQRFIPLSPTGGASFTNPNFNASMRFQGGITRFVLVKDSETQWRLVE